MKNDTKKALHYIVFYNQDNRKKKLSYDVSLNTIFLKPASFTVIRYLNNRFMNFDTDFFKVYYQPLLNY